MEEAERFSGTSFICSTGHYTLRQLAWSFYAQFDPHICTHRFKSEHYYRHIERKIRELVGRVDRLERPTVEWLYHRFRCRSWDGRVDTINGQYGYTGLPFLTTRITEIGASIPVRWKYHGAFQAELIARTDRRLASYQSSYGYPFVGPPLGVGSCWRLRYLCSAALGAAPNLPREASLGWGGQLSVHS